jgi:chemotaxis signal transduction protein
MLSPLQEGFLIAKIGSSERLLELATVREIVPAMQLARPPGVAGACRGIANVRGETIPVFDMARRDGPLSDSQLIVLAATGTGGLIGIVVDDVLDVVQLESGRVTAHPAGLGRHVRSVHLAGGTLSVLTPREVIDAS